MYDILTALNANIDREGGGCGVESGSEWEAYGLGRDDGGDEGERCVLFWRGVWRTLHRETVWLNERGEVGRKGWDAGSVRVVSCVVLEAALDERV